MGNLQRAVVRDGPARWPANDEADLGMSAEDMRRLANAATESLVARIEGLRSEAPWRGATRAELEPMLREPPPEEGRDPVEVLDRATRQVLPVAARVDHPRFFAFVPSAPTWPGVIADYLAAGYNIFQGTWLGSGGPSQLELVVIDWFRQWVGYPENAGGLFTSGGSAAILDALVAAREQAGAPERPAIIFSDQTHSAVERAARIIGVRPEGIVRVPADANFRLSVHCAGRGRRAHAGARLHADRGMRECGHDQYGRRRSLARNRGVSAPTGGSGCTSTRLMADSRC